MRCTTSALVSTSCTRRVQEIGAIGLVVLQTADILGLIIYFAIHSLCFGVPPQLWYILVVHVVYKRMVQSVWSFQNARRINHMFRNTIDNTPKPRRPGVRCTTSALVCTSCTRRVLENGAICLVLLQTAEILGLMICFAIHFLCVTIE